MQLCTFLHFSTEYLSHLDHFKPPCSRTEVVIYFTMQKGSFNGLHLDSHKGEVSEPLSSYHNFIRYRKNST